MAKKFYSLMVILAVVFLSMPLESIGRISSAPSRTRYPANSKSRAESKASKAKVIANSAAMTRKKVPSKTVDSKTLTSVNKPKSAASKKTNKIVAFKKRSVTSKRIKVVSKRKKARSNRVLLVNSKNYLWSEPWQDHSPYSASTAKTLRQAFNSGDSEKYSPQQLVRAGVFKYYPLSGGIFQRSSAIKNIVIHSTETAKEADAKRVVRSWNIRGLRHAGAQYVVDRDGSIYQTVDPKFATVHVDINKTRYGVTNNNSIGIEIVRSGKQSYTDKQMDSVEKLVAYLQNRFDVSRKQVVAHGFVQPSDRSDPVGFDWNRFFFNVAYLRSGQTTALKPKTPGTDSKAGA